MYCAKGGDPAAIPGFYDFGVKDGLVWSLTIEEFQKTIMNQSRNPAESKR
ncbi:MAG: hypothetical protein ACD_17C00068G0005 [uncultured bacterium]|nr:MAG: hypothetical protein ACD_17C00068G0005 [uncultured bacterium]